MIVRFSLCRILVKMRYSTQFGKAGKLTDGGFE